MSIQEKLIIKNFFSIKDFEWDIKGFNVLTGGMASGKSLALKLLYFCEQIFQQTIFEATISKDIFLKEIFFGKINEGFNTFFKSKDHESDYKNTEIAYTFELYKNEFIPSDNQSNQLFFDEEIPIKNEQQELDLPIIIIFDLSAVWDNSMKKLRWSSRYIESKLETWQSFFDENTPDLAERVRNRVFESISSDFFYSFPLSAMFIPASRAIAAITSKIKSRDPFIDDFMNLKEFALSFNDIGGISSDVVNKILQFQNISIDKDEQDNQPVFKLSNGRSISSLELSSGQQELLYLLLLIDDLKRTKFSYGYHASIFIEEPSAHLFPKEQKDTVNFLVASFNELQKRKRNNPGHRFFISTHSPYLLNTVNNLLEKERLLKMAKKINDLKTRETIIDRINELSFPFLSIDYVSAYMIEAGIVKSMINNDDDEPYIYSEIIDQISQEITGGTEKLFTLDTEIKSLIRTVKDA